MVGQVRRGQERRRLLEILRRGDEDAVRAHQQSADHGRVGQLAVPDRDVHRLARQLVHPVADTQCHRQARMHLRVVADPFGQELRARVRGGGNVDAAFQCVGIMAKKASAAGPRRGDRVTRLQESLALGSQAQRPRRALDEAHAELLLDPLEPCADRGGCLVELPSRLAQRPGVRHAKEQAEVVEVHGPLCGLPVVRSPAFPAPSGGTGRSGTALRCWRFPTASHCSGRRPSGSAARRPSTCGRRKGM